MTPVARTLGPVLAGFITVASFVLVTPAAAQEPGVLRGVDASTHLASEAAGDVGLLRPVTASRAPSIAATPAGSFGVLRRVGPDGEGAEARVVEIVNAERAGLGLAALSWDARLATAANRYAAEMAQGGFFSHTGADGARLVERAGAADYLAWDFLGENLAAGQPTPERVVAAWMDSPTHRANVLASEACQIGVGYAAATEGRYDEYWVMEIGC